MQDHSEPDFKANLVEMTSSFGMGVGKSTIRVRRLMILQVSDFFKRFNRFAGEVQGGSNWKNLVSELAELGIRWANLFETNSNWNSNSNSNSEPDSRFTEDI